MMKRGQLPPFCRPPAVRTAAALLLLTAAGGCELQKDLTTIAEVLGDPDAELIEGRGRQLVAGRFSAPFPVGSNADGTFVLAIEDNEELAIVRFDDGEKCTAGPTPTSGTRYAQPVESADANAGSGKALVPFLSLDADANTQLSFADLSCRLAKLSVPGGRLPMSSAFAKAGGFLVQASGGKIVRVDPWNNELEVVADKAQSLPSGGHAFIAAGASGDWLWSVEDGRVIARDRDLKVVGTVGEQVLRLTHSSSGKDGPMIIYSTATDIYVSYVSDLAHSEVLAEDACGESLSTGANGRQVYYASPCNSGTLLLAELDTGVTRELADNVVRYRNVGTRPDGPILLYLSSITEDSGANQDVGTLWVRYGAEPPIKLGDDANLVYSSVTSGASVSVVRNWEANRGGELLEGKLGEALTSIAKGVVYRNSWLGVISDFDGVDGKLLRPDGKSAYKALSERIVPWGMKLDGQRERALLLTRWMDDTGTGTLSLVDSSGLLELTDTVRPNAYDFTGQLEAVTVLREGQSDGTASLRLYDLKTDDLVSVADGVSEALEINWPSPGMLYSVPFGDEAGLWFSAAR